MKTFKQWFEASFPNETIPEKVIPGDWFAKHGLPMVVACTCCTTTMALPSALIDEDDQVFCSDCGSALDPDDGPAVEPTPNSIGGTMVRMMIEAYEKGQM